MPGDMLHRLDIALTALRMRGERPVRVWLIQQDYAAVLAECGVRSAKRFTAGGVPISVCMWPAASRVVSVSGAVELV